MRKYENTSSWVNKAKQVHGNKYDYSKVEYVNSRTKVCIICPIHGDFWQIPSAHLVGRGCSKCAIENLNNKKRSNKQQFITKAKEKHNNKYDYSKVEYVNSRTKVCIICPTHGEFWQTPNTHLQGGGCLECAIEEKILQNRRTAEDFIKEAKQIHGDKYDYSKVDANSQKDKVCIICPTHGEFWQSAVGHINNKHGCPKCNGGGFIYTNDYFIKKCKEIHHDKYCYDKAVYKTSKDKVCIICPIHGEFWQKSYVHLSGCGCPKCASDFRKEKYTLSQDEVINRFKKTHGEKYDYSKVKYVNGDTKVCIICPTHGEFWQTPLAHYGLKQGCPNCKKSKMEECINLILENNNIKFDFEKKFDWLKHNGELRLDFYLPEYNVAIECQGGQHFEPVKYFGGDDGFKRTIERDKIKNSLCKKHGITIIYIVNNSYKKNIFFKENYTNENVIFFKNNQQKITEEIKKYLIEKWKLN